MEKAIWFDMDGTIANLYGVENWLEMLINEDETPYKIATPLLRMNALARVLNRLQAQGYSVNIVSWLSKNSTCEYDRKVATAKIEWLRIHLHSVKFDTIDILPYGTPKNINRNGILFDDEIHNRETWNGIAYDENHIMEVLKSL